MQVSERELDHPAFIHDKSRATENGPPLSLSPEGGEIVPEPGLPSRECHFALLGNLHALILIAIGNV